MKKNKTVYILGAGASCASGLPIQSKIIDYIYSIGIDDIPKLSVDNFMTDSLDFTLTQDLFLEFDFQRLNLAQFILNNFTSSTIKVLPTEQDEILTMYKEVRKSKVSLEDLFTLFDKAILLRQYFQNYTDAELSKYQNYLNNCILFILEYYSQQSKSKLYDDFSNYLIRQRLDSGLSGDPFSIITLNWDTMLDCSLYKACERFSTDEKNILPDYCFYNYDTSLDIHSTNIKPMGIHNIKLIKLHGSINWVLCKNCGKIYTNFRDNLALKLINPAEKFKCDWCSSIGREYDCTSVLITPTFLKDFNNLHLKNIWFNAFIELSEASDIVFIGYSLPDADFELRYLLKRSLRKDANITIVLHESDDPSSKNSVNEKLYFNDTKEVVITMDDDISTIKTSEIKNIFSRSMYPIDRYRNLFSNHNITEYYGGIENYFNDIIF